MSDTLIDPQISARELVKKINSIGTLPEVTSKIIAIVEDPDSSSADLHEIVAHDPALVTRILKVVNSAFYGLPGQIASINRAIVLLGLNAVKNIAVAAGLGQLFRGVRLCEEFTARDLWTHCVAVAVATSDLARGMRIPLIDEAFLAGMVHDVGLLVSLQLMPGQLCQACEEARTSASSFCDIERGIMGVDHQQLGQALCELWKFPRTCQLIAAYHHRPSAMPAESRLLVTLVAVADVMCCAQRQGFNLTTINQSMSEIDYESAGLSQSVIAHTRERLPELMKSASTFL
ncbi:MAG: HDOD domain-containing protein [Tepidisphaeraceae bacterium]|jgi:HD-like signal output (HDOD) protein